MMKTLLNKNQFILFILCMLLSHSSLADEGMWLFTDLPKAQIEAKYHVKLTEEFIKKVLLSSARFPGGSGSFISSTGLILTNHHVAKGSLVRYSTPKKNYLNDGFYAKELKDELKVDGMKIFALKSIKEITGEVEAALKSITDPKKIADVRDLTIKSEIEKYKLETKLYVESVILFGGARIQLHAYKVYKDIRLVFAPEEQIGFFGGDKDNFEFPRYDLDMAIFRAYENGIPAVPSAFLNWSAGSLRQNELVFLVGNPGKTQRLVTSAGLEFLRDVYLPFQLSWLENRRNIFYEYAKIGDLEKIKAEAGIFGTENTLKVFRGRSKVLQKGEVIRNKKLVEMAIIDFESKNNHHQYQWALDGIRFANEVNRNDYVELALLESATFVGQSDLFSIARHMLRWEVERVLPSEDRLLEYRYISNDDIEEKLKKDLIALYKSVDFNLEKIKISKSLHFALAYLDINHSVMKTVIASGGVEKYADLLVESVRNSWTEDKIGSVICGNDKASELKDGMIALALLVEHEARSLRHDNETKVINVENANYPTIAKSSLKYYGNSSYPDGTFSLRLAYGEVRGYTDDEGREIPAWTNMRGAFQHQKENLKKPPFLLPDSWNKRRFFIRKNTPFNFVSTFDRIGGNSGSPVVNRFGDLVGLYFDGNRFGHITNYAYDPILTRGISVDVRAMIEAMKHIYKAKKLLNELNFVNTEIETDSAEVK